MFQNISSDTTYLPMKCKGRKVTLQHPFQKSFQLCQTASSMLALGMPPSAFNSTLERLKYVVWYCRQSLQASRRHLRQHLDCSTRFHRLRSWCGSTVYYQCANIFLKPVKPSFSSYVLLIKPQASGARQHNTIQYDFIDWRRRRSPFVRL